MTLSMRARVRRICIVCRWAVLIVALGWSACGLRSGMSVAPPDAEAQGGASGAVAGSVAQGGSGGRGGGGSAGHGTGGIGGNGSGGSGNGGVSGRAGAGGAMVHDAGPWRADVLEAAIATPAGTPKVDPGSGYTTIATGTVVMSGYVTATAQGSGSSISLTYDDHSFCASGTVSASTKYKSWAVVAFSVNQDESGLSGSTAPLLLTGSELTVTYENRAGSQLDFQLWDGDNFWCHFLPTSTGTHSAAIPFSSLNTECWDGTGTSFTSGTPITSVQLVVPGSPLGATPFDYCFLGLTVR
jgi:hypothetical protein